MGGIWLTYRFVLHHRSSTNWQEHDNRPCSSVMAQYPSVGLAGHTHASLNLCTTIICIDIDYNENVICDALRAKPMQRMLW